MKCYSLFSGIGGFDLACQRNGIDVVGACEIDKFARQVYQKHFPKIKIWEDATKIKPEELPDFQLLTAGFPCQAFSLAGKRLGFEDTRGTLFYEIARIAKQKRPRIIFLENVRGLLYDDEGRTFTTIIKTFYELGYDIEWQVINSKYFLPQSRSRVYIIGHLRGENTRKIFPIGTENNYNQNQIKKMGEVAGTAISSYGKRPSDGQYLVVSFDYERKNGRAMKEPDSSFTIQTRASRNGLKIGERLRIPRWMDIHIN